MDNEKIEGMLSQLIKMVETIHSDQQEMKAKINGMEQRMDKMEQTMDRMEERMDRMELRLDKVEEKNEKRHGEVIEHLKTIENDQDFIWEKSVRNERELGNIKRRLS